MQSQPEFNKNKSSNSKSKTATSNSNNNYNSKQQLSEAASHHQQLQQQNKRVLRTTKQQQQQTRPLVIKSKQPLINFKFYLDIHDHQLTKQIEKQIQFLGGRQEFFLDANITHFITDKVELPANVLRKSVTPVTPQTPKQQNSINEYKNAVAASSPIARTRADAILRRVRQQSTTTTTTTTIPTVSSPINISDKPLADYIIWQTEYALRFFKKVQHELKAYLQPENRLKSKHNTTTIKTARSGSSSCASDILTLKGGFIKIESIKRSCRPYYQTFRYPNIDWPKLSLNSEEGAFCLTAAPAPAEKQLAMTRKSRSRSSQCAATTTLDVRKTTTVAATPTMTASATKTPQSQCRQIKDSSEKQCGVCDICKVEFDTLTIHLKTKDHEYFARNSQNFIALDTLIQSSADVNKFLDEEVTKVEREEMEEMELEVEQNDLVANINIDAQDPLEQPLEMNNFSPPLREKSKRSTKGKHSSEKFQFNNKRNNNKTTTTATTTKVVNATPPKTLEITPTKNTNTRKKPNNNNKNANLSSPIRPFPPPSSLYKVVETSQMETTTRRAAGVGTGVACAANENDVTASPSLIVKIKKVRNAALLRLNGEAESFMFPKTIQRRASSDLPTDIDRQSSSERLRTSIYSSSSLDSSSISDIVVNMVSPEEHVKKIVRNKSLNLTKNKNQSFQSTPIQPNVQLKRLRKSATTTTPVKTKTTTTTNKKSNVVVLNELSPPSAAAAIVAATAKITLPAATRKSSRMATAIVSAATTSSRLLRAAAEVVKKSGRNANTIKISQNLTTATTTKRTIKKAEEEYEEEADLETTTKTLTPNNRIRRCRKAVTNAKDVVKMEDRMGDSSEANTDDDELNENEEEVNVFQTTTTTTRKSRTTRNVKNLKNLTTTTLAIEDDDDDDDDFDDDIDDIDNDDKADKDFKYKFSHNTTIKPRSRRGRRKKLNTDEMSKKKLTDNNNKNNNNNNNNNKKVEIASATNLQQKQNKSTPYYDYTKSERIQQHNYAFERVPESDLWYRVFTRQDNCEEVYFNYFSSQKYHKLPYELGPIPYYHTKLTKNCCKLCEPLKQCEQIENEHEEQNKSIKTETTTTTTTAATSTTTTTPYALKHKKLHLLQRYRQEQAALQEEEKLKQQQQQQENCQIKSENLFNGNIEHRERADSTHSTSSSCASISTTTTQNTKKSAFRNKLLAKTAFLGLEMPPRKSPREHASTLALVSIIKQRQESKPNSDAEEIINSVPTTPIPKEETQTNVTTTTNIRSAATTPVEEMCFATEISENVKRMRRGRNKYDHSPPYVVNNSRRRLARQKLNKSIVNIKTEVPVEKPKTPELVEKLPEIIKPQRSMLVLQQQQQQKKTTNVCASGSMLHSKTINNLPPSVRKTGQKKGVLEFSVDECALKALDAALQPMRSVLQQEREIDQFLENTGKDFDIDELLLFGNDDLRQQTAVVDDAQENDEGIQESTTEAFINNTPPATDYFSSDFDLCDLLQEAQNTILGGEEAQKRSRESKHLSLYNTMALNKYFRKRKYMKSNRTGWPKLQKKKYSMRHQTLKANELKKHLEANKTTITPPNSDAAVGGDTATVGEEQELKHETVEEEQILKESDDDDDDTFYDGVEEEEEEDANTVLDSVADEQEEVQANVATAHVEEYEKALEADDEDEFNDAVEEEIDENTMPDEKSTEHVAPQPAEENEEEEEVEYEPKIKRSRRNSSLGKALVNCLNSMDNAKVDENMEEDTNSMTAATTSTPTKNLTRNLRRTPQLNGSLLSCHSPSERAGDNSDIFTVSSDGLDTDLDLSNPHAHTKQEEQAHNVTCNNNNNNRANSSKGKKYDISKYVKNPAANTCAAEAATAAARSLAIAQFLKKEVRVTCRRIRAPFRRFRYRR